METTVKPIPRHEIKHIINVGDYWLLRQRLSTICQHDKFAEENGQYKIRSLYFDNDDDKALKEKLFGISKREKFRIRYYNDDLSFIKLEKKSKFNSLCYKEAATITQEEAKKIVNHDIEWMRSSKKPLLVEFYAKMCYQGLKPKTIVDYLREPYIFSPGNTRITIDREIRTGIFSQQLFDQKMPSVPILKSYDIMVLEIKYDDFLPQIIQKLSQVGSRQNTAFSKYANCRIFG